MRARSDELESILLPKDHTILRIAAVDVKNKYFDEQTHEDPAGETAFTGQEFLLPPQQ